MLGSSLIVFRESLEAALLIGIIAAATIGLPGRNRWITIGICFGLVGALVMAKLTGKITDMADGTGQEIVRASILGIAVLMLAWHTIWMSSHGKEMARSARTAGKNIRDGQTELSAIAVVIGMAVLREGAETVLFLYGISTSPGSNRLNIMLGGLMGLGAGTFFGYMIYRGLILIPVQKLFSVTDGLLILLASGLSSQMAKFLMQADYIPTLWPRIWDTSWLISDSSTLGVALHILAGYDPRPSGTQAIFYFATLTTIYLASRIVKAKNQMNSSKSMA